MPSALSLNYKVSQSGAQLYALDAAGSDTYAITLSPAPAAYVNGMVVTFGAGTLNTGACTLNVNALGAKAIVKNYNQALATGDILAGQLVTVVYDGTSFQMQSTLGTAVAGGGGKILQVIQDTKTDAYTQTTNTFTTIPTLSAGITPASTSNTVFVQVMMNAGGRNASYNSVFRLRRDTTNILQADAAGSRVLCTTVMRFVDTEDIQTVNISYIDSPASTSALAYTVQTATTGTASLQGINRNVADTDDANHSRGTSTIIVMEIDGT